MSENFETYEEIAQALNITINTCLNYYKNNPEELNSLLSKKRKGSKGNGINHFVDLSLDLNTIKQQYMRYKCIYGEIGTVNEKQQFNGIINMSLLAMCANKITKLNDNHLSKSVLRSAQVMIGLDKGKKTNFYVVKQKALSTLLASILVLSETSKDYRNFFCYGNYKDENEEEGFIIDLPYYGQIALHYGNNKENIISMSKLKAKSILKRKCELGQISQKDIEEIEISDDKILPQYTGKLYEYVGGFPIKNDIDAKEYLKEKCNIKPNNMTLERIKHLVGYRKINDREKYFLLVKRGSSKNELESFLSEVELTQEKKRKKDFAKEIGKKCQEEVSVNERQIVDDMLKNVDKGRNKDENIH